MDWFFSPFLAILCGLLRIGSWCSTKRNCTADARPQNLMSRGAVSQRCSGSLSTKVDSVDNALLV